MSSVEQAITIEVTDSARAIMDSTGIDNAFIEKKLSEAINLNTSGVADLEIGITGGVDALNAFVYQEDPDSTLSWKVQLSTRREALLKKISSFHRMATTSSPDPIVTPEVARQKLTEFMRKFVELYPDDVTGFCISGGAPTRIVGGGFDVSLDVEDEESLLYDRHGVRLLDLYRLLVKAAEDSPEADTHDLTDGIVGHDIENFRAVAQRNPDIDRKTWTIKVEGLSPTPTTA